MLGCSPYTHWMVLWKVRKLMIFVYHSSCLLNFECASRSFLQGEGHSRGPLHDFTTSNLCLKLYWVFTSLLWTLSSWQLSQCPACAAAGAEYKWWSRPAGTFSCNHKSISYFTRYHHQKKVTIWIQVSFVFIACVDNFYLIIDWATLKLTMPMSR